MRGTEGERGTERERRKKALSALFLRSPFVPGTGIPRLTDVIRHFIVVFGGHVESEYLEVLFAKILTWT